MIIRNRRGVEVELRATPEWGNESRIPLPGSGYISSSGTIVSEDQAMGVPAVSNVIRSPAELVASLPFIVYQRGQPRERAEQSWQWQLLHERPSDECDTFDFFYDLALSVEAAQNAFIQKVKGIGSLKNEIVAMYVLDPQRVRVYRDKNTGEKRFDIYTSEGRVEGLTSSEILHVRGYTPNASIAGVSLLMQHKDAVGAAIAMQGFEGDYFRNSGLTPFFFTGAANQEQAKEMVDLWNSQHAGVGKQWKPGGLWGTGDVKTIPLSLGDALFAEAKKLSIEDACRIWRWPKQLLELEGEAPVADESAWTSRFLKFYFLPRLRRIERAFAADTDLFPTSGPGSGRFSNTSSLFGEFLTAALERADFVTRVRGYKDARQGGWITANEIREPENLPPLPGGDELLATPTGSAPNPPSGEVPPSGA